MALELDIPKRLREKAHPPSESTAIFIRHLLLKKSPRYVLEMHKLWCKHLERLGMKPPRYDSFCRYVRVVAQAGLIRLTSQPKGVDIYKGNLKPVPRKYYELVPSRVNDLEKWRNPQVVVYGEKMRLGARRYSRRVLHLPRKTEVGRPRKSSRLAVD